VATSLNEAFDIARASDGGEEVFIIGGAFVYEQTIDLVDRLYITFVDGHFDGNKFFPVIDPKKWREVSRRRKESDEQNKYNMDFVVFNRVTAQGL
ncbi:MAG TPA: dihydrofolate reductase, partial [Candidatus Kaiserbacteria bacterium]|nr:dihydrofolate reductase [Candidatus Kaiserbacteria bacterium]